MGFQHEVFFSSDFFYCSSLAECFSNTSAIAGEEGGYAISWLCSNYIVKH